MVYIGYLCGPDDLPVRGIVLSVGNIFTDRAFEQPGILKHHAEFGAQVLPLHMADVNAVNKDGA